MKANIHIVLRLPLYHCELNPIELAGSSVKNHVWINNKTFKLPDVNILILIATHCGHKLCGCGYEEEFFKTSKRKKTNCTKSTLLLTRF